MSPQRPILVVDDDADIRETLNAVLSDEGFAVTTAANGIQALTLLRDGLRPAVILLDLMMPVMDGFQFRAAQRRDPTLAGIPVVLLTAHGTVEEARATIRPDAILQKPVRIEPLLDAILRLSEPRPAASAAR